MKFDARLKGGLAWTGLIVVLAVPSADILFGANDRAAPAPSAASVSEASAPAAAVVPAARPVAVSTPTVPAATAGAVQTAETDPVQTYINSGKKLPSYISDGDQAPAPVAVTSPVAPATPETVEVASLPDQTAPVPLPRSARPAAPVVAATPRPATNIAPFPPSDVPVVSGERLEEWDSGSLADYLEQEGLLSPSSTPADAQASGEYDPDGFYLDEGPNNSQPRRLRDREFFLF